ncbi:hypothetical protein CEXT_759481, partial [Caerostris extrusa]
ARSPLPETQTPDSREWTNDRNPFITTQSNKREHRGRSSKKSLLKYLSLLLSARAHKYRHCLALEGWSKRFFTLRSGVSALYVCPLSTWLTPFHDVDVSSPNVLFFNNPI